MEDVKVEEKKIEQSQEQSQVEKNERIIKLKVEIFDLIRQQEPLVVQRQQLYDQINRTNDLINRLDSMKAPKARELFELEKKS